MRARGEHRKFPVLFFFEFYCIFMQGLILKCYCHSDCSIWSHMTVRPVIWIHISSRSLWWFVWLSIKPVSMALYGSLSGWLHPLLHWKSLTPRLYTDRTASASVLFVITCPLWGTPTPSRTLWESKCQRYKFLV